MPNVGPQMAVASDRLAAATTAAAAMATRSVVRIELRADGVEGATAVHADALDSTPTALPATFTLIQPPDAPARTTAWVVSAEGYTAQTVEAPVVATTEPVLVQLRRPSSRNGGSSGNSGSSGTGGRRPGTGLDDPYGGGR